MTRAKTEPSEAQYWRALYDRIDDAATVSEVKAAITEALSDAHARGRVAGLREAAELLQPHKPNCRKWECANCTRASAVLALAGETERG